MTVSVLAHGYDLWRWRDEAESVQLAPKEYVGIIIGAQHNYPHHSLDLGAQRAQETSQNRALVQGKDRSLGLGTVAEISHQKTK